MNGIIELEKHIREKDNPAAYSPIFGKIISLPNLTIRLGDRILLDKGDIKATFNLHETQIHDGQTEYIHLNKEVVLLPYGRDNKFLAIEVVNEKYTGVRFQDWRVSA